MFHRDGPSFFELVRQGLSSTRRGYDLLADRFDVTPFRTPDEVLAPAIAHLAAERPIETALDLCCGTGAAIGHLRPVVTRTVTGIDFSEGMLRVCRNRFDEDAVDLVHGDVLAMDFVEVFDLAVCFGALGHILPEDEDRFVAGIYRALKPGGRFAFATGEHPGRLSLPYFLSATFNTVMRLRNLLWKPAFIMYYLTFLLPEVVQRLEKHGFTVDIRERLFLPPYARMKLVVAHKPASG